VTVRWVFVLLVLCSACKSKPSKDKSPHSKASLEAVTNTVEIDSVVAYCPRRSQELADAILLNPKVHACLRMDPGVRDPQFAVGVEGQLDYKGLVENVQVMSASETLRDCLRKQLPAIHFGRGRSGPFKMQIIRAQDTGKKSKAVLLDLSEVKKWE